ncbi:MAG: competence/damage-inducible protein A [Bacteroidales bacterium]|nr:competence/damage-inducible protein A [Bacteroidales bacterium]MBN2763902.1 competence/damage-inducible protein A [Bacteroidales bacterium]
MLAEIITIGDEILIGQVVDSNSAFIADALNKIGIRVGKITSIGDIREQIIAALDDASKYAGLVIMTGGLGPTNDDITKQTLAEYFNTRLVLNTDVLDHIRTLLIPRGIRIHDSNIRQAELPENCSILHNAAGTAQGMLFKKSNTIYISLPGVPFEMKGIMTDHVIPMLKDAFMLDPIQHLTVHTHGLGESAMALKIASWEEQLSPAIKLAYLPSPGILRLRLSVYNTDIVTGNALLETEMSKLRSLISDYIFGYDSDTLEEITGKILRDKGLTLSVAESCTGGKIASMITSVPGCSDYFMGSVIAYSNDSKCKLLGVSHEDIDKNGAVSRLIAEEMARGARCRFNADIAVATTGIAGPSGGTTEKPVGSVWIAVSTTDLTTAERFTFGDNRSRNIQRAAIAALFMLRKVLIKMD